MSVVKPKFKRTIAGSLPIVAAIFIGFVVGALGSNLPQVLVISFACAFWMAVCFVAGGVHAAASILRPELTDSNVDALKKKLEQAFGSGQVKVSMLGFDEKTGGLKDMGTVGRDDEWD